MKKLFLLIPALVLSLAINAKEINITPTSPHSSGNNLLATLADAGTEDGDVIILADGTYNESSNYISFDKSVEVRAAEGAHPVVEVECEVRIGKNASGKNINIRGIKFDASKQDGTGNNATSYSHFIRIYSAGTLDFEDCEFYSSANKVIEVESSSSVDNLVINNCYFHDNTKSCIYIDNTVASNLTITNSTFANSPTTSKGTIFSKAAASSIIRIDHCTFYDCTTESTDYGVIGHNGFLPTDAVVSNSIFAWNTTYDKRATYLPSGTSVTNCLTYNTNKDTDKWGHHSGPTFTNCSLQDPLFNDLANNKYTFAGDWTSMTISPARGAATDGSDLGDPRWYSAEVLPETDFASPYVLTGDKAKLAGKVATDASNYLQFSNTSDATQHGVAIWKVHATRSCILQATLNIDADNGSGHRYQIEVFDSSNTLVGSAIGESANSWDKGDKVISDLIMLSEAGDYKIKLSNLCDNSANLLHSITLSYAGGEVQNMPGTTDINDAWFSSNGTRADGKISYSSISSGCWAKWNIAVANTAWYNVTVDICGQYGHDYTVEFLKEGETTPIIVTKGATNYTNDLTLYHNDLGLVQLEAGNYEMTVSNAVGDAALIGVTLAYDGGAVQNMPGTTNINDAWFSSNGTRTGGAIEYTSINDGCWAKWNIAVATAGTYNVTVNIKGQYGHDYTVEFLKEGESTPIVVTKGATNYTNDLTLYANELGTVELDAANYVITVSNSVGDASLISVTLTYAGGAIIVLPATLNANDASFSASAYADAGEIHFVADPYSHNVVGEWAKWKVRVNTNGTFLFTMNVNSDNGQSYKISIMDDGDNLIDFCDLKASSGATATLKHYFNLVAGDYYVKVENTRSWSHGYVTGLVVTQPSLLVLNEAAETNTVIHDNYRNGAHDIQIIRTIVPGMYNSICLPFDVNSAQLQAIFGSDVELLQMSSAELNGNELDLNFEAATSIYRGTPYLIKTSKTVTNPVFAEVEIKAEVGDATSGTAADFIGTLIKGEVPAGEDNLFLGQNDMLYFSSTATPIKGMRAWFKVKVSNPQHVIQHARIVTGGQVVTSIDLVNGEIVNETVKAIENGQLVIIRDGVRYNAMGIHLQ